MEFLIALVVWVLIWGGLTAWLASEKGRDPLVWFILGGLFALLAIIVVGLSPNVEQTPAPANSVAASPAFAPVPAASPTRVAAPAPATKKCPDCAETVLAEARICRFCRYEFPPSPVAELRPSVEPPPAETPVEPLGGWYVVTSTLAGLAAGGLVRLEDLGGAVRLSSQHSGVTLSAFSVGEAPWAGTSTSVLRLWTSDGEVTLQPMDGQNVRETMAWLRADDPPRGPA